ncbi:MAG TPA: hypothetical protein VLT62_18945 [Candidatus Methylomirabilis sp.]|nr:hypothetical protein [Candidatus Methylomirabilis sp.]
MSEPTKIESQRRFIQDRAKDLLARVPRMDDEELRWTIRVFVDCLSPEQRDASLESYSEHWDLERLRSFVSSFIRRYADLALEDLSAKAGGPGTRLRDLTDEELQGMTLAEKCSLLAADPSGLRPYQVRRELARLFMCKSYDLFHDAGLSEAAVEFPAYHRVREALEAQPDAVVADLLRMVLARADRFAAQSADLVEAALTEIREAIARRLGILIPVDQLFTGQMVKLPLDHPDESPEADSHAMDEAVAEMSPGDLATAFLVLTDLMSLREWDEYLLPLRRQYRSLIEIPPEALRALLPRLAARMGDRRITDFAERYRSGRMVAERKVTPLIWDMLPATERLALLERDNRTMDVAQVARCLAKIFSSYQYEMLFDADFHVELLRSPRYQRLISRLIARHERGRERQGLEELMQIVTRTMLEIEGLPFEARPARLQEVRARIATALGLPDDLTYAASKEGRA